MPITDQFAGNLGGPAVLGGGPPGAWFDGDDTTVGVITGLGGAGVWDTGVAVDVDYVRIRWSFGDLFPGGGAAASFELQIGDDPVIGPWTTVLADAAPHATAGVSYPQDFEITYDLGSRQTGRYWRLRNATSNNNDIFTVEGQLDEPDDPDDPPVDPGYEPPDPGKAILEIYVHDEDATRWGTATWSADLIPTGTEGIWSGAGWQDVTPVGLRAHVSWGSQRPERGILAVQEAQSWLVDTFDPDRILDPGNPDGPYYPEIRSGVPIRISHATSGSVIRTGIIDRIRYAHRGPDYRGTIQASSSIAVANRAQVPEDSVLDDTLDARVRDAFVASGIGIGGVPIVSFGSDEYPALDLSPRLEGRASLWEHIRRAGEELLWVAYEDQAGTFQFRPWGNPLDRGREITYENLEDLESSTSDDGVYSAVRVLNEAGDTVLDRVAAPLPRYGRIYYTGREDITTINPESWADAVLADRSWPGVSWTPGVVWCFDANEVEYFATLEIMERVRVVVPGAVDVAGRILGMELWVEQRTAERARWLFLPKLATDGESAIGTTTLVADGTGDVLIDDATETDYLEED